MIDLSHVEVKDPGDSKIVWAIHEPWTNWNATAPKRSIQKLLLKGKFAGAMTPEHLRLTDGARNPVRLYESLSEAISHKQQLIQDEIKKLQKKSSELGAIKAAHEEDFQAIEVDLTMATAPFIRETSEPVSPP